MKFSSQICTTKEQSERLLALGLKRETADMGLIGNIPIVLATTWANADPMFDTPAWSLHRLLCLIPNEYFADVDFQNVMQRCIFATSTLYDDLIDLIEALIKEEYFYEEYLDSI